MAVVMGTAGHIDHGKTTLVKALTGTDCDRLEEEKRRGITIELGFAILPLPEGRSLSIVDVPGHERFVKNMVAGAAGVDFVLLVIAADEGVMPQTREHLEICSLLGVCTGLVVLTKADAVEPDLLALAKEEVQEFLQGSFLEGAPVLAVSAQTGQGMDTLIQALATLEKGLNPERRTDLFRLPVDRVFTMKGHGTVVTGTMVSGSVRVGDDVVLHPTGLTSKVRALQSHGDTVQTALAGRRTAVNLHSLEVESIERGSVLSHPGCLFPALRWIVSLICLPSSPRPLRHRGEVHFHHGAREIQARLYFCDRDALAPGEQALCEVRFPEPVPGVFGDRCVVRSFSPLRTVAGGTVLHPLDFTWRKRHPAFTRHRELLTHLAASFGLKAPALVGNSLTAEEEERVRSMVELGGTAGVAFAHLCVLTNIESRRLEKILGLMGGKQQVFCFDKEEKRYVGDIAMAALSTACLHSMEQFHKANPAASGINRGAMASGWGRDLASKLVHTVTERLIKQGSLVVEADTLRLAGHTASLGSNQVALRRAIYEAHKAGGCTPPNMKEVLEALHLPAKEAAPVLKLMQEAGEITRVAEGIWYDTASLGSIVDAVRGYFSNHDNLDIAGLKEITGLSRKYLIALLEYFDREKITVRVGDKRILRG